MDGMIWSIILSLRDVAPAMHITAGSLGLILGPVAILAAKRPGRHTLAGTAYFVAITIVCCSAAGLAVIRWHSIWWFLPIAAFSYFWAPVGYGAARRRYDGWLRWHVVGQGGSYIALTTALLVVNLGTAVPLAWALPTLIGAPLIRRAVGRLPVGAMASGRRSVAT